MNIYKPFLLNLRSDVFTRVVTAAREQHVTITQFLRQSVERNLRHYESVERPMFLRLASDGMR